MLRLYDTGSGQVSELALREPGRVSMYVCGPTVYDLPHIGHGRFVLVFDILRRYLEWSGLEVRHVSNITDIDDRIIARAEAGGRSTSEVVQEFEAAWWEAVDGLGVLRPTVDPHATAYVREMVELVADLVDRGAAYETSDGVYFVAEAVPDYGLLARQATDSLRAGARIGVSDEKRSPLDFALWKKAKPGEPSWESPWGPGRPGWHTECVVMALDLLGDGFDLHGGGQDLAFPHHENERAQAVALGHRFAGHWVHNGFVEVGGEKMSKSLGNFTSLTELLATTDPRAYRLLVLRAHYRSPVEVTKETTADAERALERLDGFARRFADTSGADAPGAAGSSRGRVDELSVGRFRDLMDDDLSTPLAVAQVFELVNEAYGAADAGEHERAAVLAATVFELAGVLGLTLGRTDDVDDEAAALVAKRDEARAARDWPRADAIRATLQARGWVVEDGPAGTAIHR